MGHVRSGDGVDARQGAGVLELDGDDPGVRHGGAHDAHPDLTGPVHVVHVVSLAAQQAVVLEPQRARGHRSGVAASPRLRSPAPAPRPSALGSASAANGRSRRPACTSAAWRTASRMPW